jgi:hypothetical protein
MHPTAGDLKPKSDPNPDAVKARRQTWFIVGGLIFASVAFFFGNNHIVQSADGTIVVSKVHFTFSETFVSAEAITGQPLIAAKAKYPLAVKALQRDGLIETDEQMQQRIQREVQEQVEQGQRDLAIQQAADEARVQQDLKITSESTTADSFSWSITGVVTNTGDRPYQFVSVEYELLAADGETVVGTASDVNAGEIRPGGKWRFKAMVIEDSAKRYRFSSVTAQPSAN